ncbi:hypothetical protein SOPP22_09515 [Shewanella sp. OPT22]|nr:hypothetical protein SOPP22_09515 [Shewanella sp. OPT22]
MTTQQERVRVLTTLSSSIEFYDFALIIFLAPTLSKVFYPSDFQHQGLMAVLGIFAFGYLSRIIGGVIIGERGDRKGRKPAFVFSIGLMAFATLAISLLPSYQQMGYIGAFLLAVLRVTQGLALGGEVPGAIVFCTEHNNARKRGYSTSLIIFGVTFGNILASGLQSVLSSLLTQQQFLAWGWRIMFVVGAGLSLISLLLRFSVKETSYFTEEEKHPPKEAPPIYQLLKMHPKAVFKGFLLTSLAAISISSFYQLMSLQPSLRVMKSTIHFFVFSSFIIISTSAVLVGMLSDKIGRLPIVQMSCAVFSLFPLSYFYFHKTNIIFTFIPLIIGSALILGVFTAILAELFPTSVRYSGVACCYNLGFAICGGLTPLILEKLNLHGMFMSISVLPCVIAGPLLIYSFFWKDNFRSPLTSQSP